ncbi:zinc finger protein Xfin-like [Malaya genurostris]|uniref:zinc finger protein Xfin-like n=1 Tax=Malaya genurostris TaxID=325434 RepID=UPI0026F3AFCF|nr:zinc finger protein Xfin-like [Malaya genurostris]
MDLSASSREDPFSADGIFSQQDLPLVPNESLESYCRLCLTTPDVEPLFPMGSDPNIYALELIGKYIGIDLTSQEDIRCAICRPCQLILDQFDLFRQNCLKVDIAIRRRRLGLDKVMNSEPLDDAEGDDGEEPAYIRLADRHYQCRLCSKVFPSLAVFMNHCKEYHPEESKVFKCKYCTKSFMTKTARLQHIRSHQPNNAQEMDMNSDRIQVCEKCMATFDSYKLLKIHLKEHSNDPKQDPLTCITCQKQFSRITILRNHILRVHLGKLPHVCKHCGISFGYSRQLLVHLQTEHGVIISGPELVNQSGQSLNEDDEQEEEIPKPTVEKPREMPPRPPTPHHTATHRKKSDYMCSECTVSCSTTEELRTHRKLHQDPTWWKCIHCRNFVKHQKMHLMKKHPSINADDVDAAFQLRYRCWLCRVYFKSLQQMEQHVSSRHEVELPNNQPELPKQPPVPEKQALVPVMAAPGPPPMMTAQPPMPIGAEHLPLLLSQLENGAWDYLRDMARFLTPESLSAFSVKVKDELPEPMDTTTTNDVVDLSATSEYRSANNSSTSMSVFDVQIKDDPDQMEDMDNDSEDETYIRLENRFYQCRVCSETFRHLLQIRKHTKAQHPTEWKSFKCEHCKRRFPSAAIRDRHAHFHTLNHPFKCTDCDQMYDSKRRIEQHFAMFHDIHSSSFSVDRIQCEPCNLWFVEKKYYDLHSRIFHQRKPQRLKNLTDTIQVCERCLATFSSRELLVDHIKKVHVSDPPLKNPECPRCSKDLKTMTLLRIHLLVVHLGMLPFVCQHCSAAFATRHWLLKHIEKEHTELPVFNCPSCDETFTDEQKRNKHETEAHQPPPPSPPPPPPPPLPPAPVVGKALNIFAGSEMIPCTKCDKKLETKDLLGKHMIKAHPAFMLLYKCPLCVKPIRYRKQHMRVHHDVEYEPKEHHYQTRYKCHCCSKLFKQKRNLTSHLMAHPFHCDNCMMRFKTKKQLSAHSAVHRTSRSLKCADCGLEFGYPARLQEHRTRFHSSTSTEVLKLHNCPYCPKIFMSLSNRERHISVTHPQNDFQVRCGHCDLEKTDSMSLRKHYKMDHPNDRVTFKCSECDKVYLNLSSYKDHLKKHTATGKVRGDSTSSATANGEENTSLTEGSTSAGAENSSKILSETEIKVEETKLMPSDGATTATEIVQEPEIKEEEIEKIPSDGVTVGDNDEVNVVEAKENEQTNEPEQQITVNNNTNDQINESKVQQPTEEEKQDIDLVTIKQEQIDIGISNTLVQQQEEEDKKEEEEEKEAAIDGETVAGTSTLPDTETDKSEENVADKIIELDSGTTSPFTVDEKEINEQGDVEIVPETKPVHVEIVPETSQVIPEKITAITIKREVVVSIEPLNYAHDTLIIPVPKPKAIAAAALISKRENSPSTNSERIDSGSIDTTSEKNKSGAAFERGVNDDVKATSPVESNCTETEVKQQPKEKNSGPSTAEECGDESEMKRKKDGSSEKGESEPAAVGGGAVRSSMRLARAKANSEPVAESSSEKQPTAKRVKTEQPSDDA